MKKLFNKDEVWFAVMWIVIYVLGFGNADSLSEAMGRPKLLTVFVGLALSVILLGFIRKNRLWDYLGLCRFRGSWQHFLFFIPLAVMTSVNLWNGLQLNYDISTSLLTVLSMCFVGFLEEVIFRGLLFKGMCKSSVKAAVIVSSLTFGAGHIVNLFLGAPLTDTLLQLVYASAIGFCYTAIFLEGGSILPCIISHALFNSLSTFATEPSAAMNLTMALAQTLMGVGYGLWLLRRRSKSTEG